MKILLVGINAKYIHANPGIYSLAAYSHMYGDYINIKEYTINHQIEDICFDIYREKADVIGFSCYIWNISIVLEICDTLKKINPKISIWLGGPEVSYDSASLLEENPTIDGIMRGESEEIFNQLAGLWVDEKGSLSSIDGITYRQDGAIISNKDAAPVDMNKLPFIYHNISLFDHKIIYYESSRGCPYRCSYCLSSIDKQVRFKDIAKVLKELKIFLDMKVPQVKFVDRTFNCRHDHTKEIWKYLLEHDNGVTNFHFEITADLLDEEEIHLLSQMRPGLVQLEIGVQSTNPQTIDEIRRKVNFQKLKKVVTSIQSAANVHQHLDLIAGLPWEDLESFKKSFNQVYALKPEQLQLGFLKVLKGSWMYENRQAYELVYQTKPMYEVISTKWMSFDDILYLKDVENVLELFYNSGQFTWSIGYLEHFFDTGFDLYAALGQWFGENDLHSQLCRREQRYKQLLDFAKSYVPDITLMIQLLTCDLYARENVKSRPQWAMDLEPYKMPISQLYNEEEFRKVYLPDYASETYRTMRHYTHMEPLDYNMEEAVASGSIVKEKRYILFNYRDKDPLTSAAAMKIIGLEKDRELS